MKLDLKLPIDIKKAETYFEKLKKDGAKIELKKVNQPRSISQNSYLHICLSIFSKETGFTISESKEVLANQFGSFMVYQRDGYTFRTSTSSIDTKQMGEFIEFIRQFSNEQLGMYIPDSTEFLINKFNIEKEYGI